MDNKLFDRVNSNIKKSNSGKYLVVFAAVIMAIGFNYFYSFTMMLLTTFTLAYLTKGSRRP